MYSRFDGFYKEDETTLWATTNTGNRRVLKIVATDPAWTSVEAVYAREPTSCDTGDNGPTTGVLIGDMFVTSGDKIEGMKKSSLKLVWPGSSRSVPPERRSSHKPAGKMAHRPSECLWHNGLSPAKTC